jgi:hypothetical protein
MPGPRWRGREDQMPKKLRTPQEKKQLSLKKDRRNTYGENAKSSRKNIARNKQDAHQKVRAEAREALTEVARSPDEATETLQSNLKTARLNKGRWRKSPDTPLGKVVASKLEQRVRDTGAKKRRRAKRTGEG